MKKQNLLKKLTAHLLIGIVLFSSMGGAVYAEELPYDTYNYNYREYVVITPAAYVPNGSVTGMSVGTSNFSEPQDFCVSEEGEVYIADTKNNRIVVLNEDMSQLVREIDGFTRDGAQDTFNQPYGVCVSENGQLYVADSMNKRIVVLTKEGEFIKTIESPQSPLSY